jgi:exosome complex component RRP42
MNKKQREHLSEFLSKDIRFDGRKLTEYRDLKIEYDVSATAEGSAKVSIGDTVVIAGVKLGLGTPYSDSPDEGTFTINVELAPISSSDFESGPPSIKAIELSRVVDRGIRESKSVDMKTLCIESGEKVWMLSVDIIPLNVDGNLFDAAAIAAVAALSRTVFPEYKDGKVDYKVKTDKKLELSKKTIAITVVMIDGKIILDPTAEEELAIDARLTVGTTDEGTICSMQKGGDHPLTLEQIETMVDLATETANMVRKKLK